MPDALKIILKPLTSLKLTIACLLLAMVLVFIGTLAQQNLDAFYAQKEYFNAWLLWWTPKGSGFSIPWFPGGFLLGSVLLVNLIAAHTARFKMSWKKTGITLTHLGLICMLVGGLFTALWSKDTRMIIAPGSTANYVESFKEFELAVIDKSDPGHDTVVSIPESFLAKKKTVANPALPFTVQPLEYIPNARMSMRPAGAPSQGADKGMGVRIDAVPVPVSTRPVVTADDENYPAAFVQLSTPAGPLGTWLLWAEPFGQQMPPQQFTVDGKTFELQLRLQRFYKPYQIHLYHLTHEIYAGTDIPKNFASQIHLSDPAHNEDRDVLIYMNHPLRYHGETFYQNQVLRTTDEYTVFEVVKNPSWWLPYLSCLMVGLGLMFQFGMHLVNFTKRRLA